MSRTLEKKLFLQEIYQRGWQALSETDDVVKIIITNPSDSEIVDLLNYIRIYTDKKTETEFEKILLEHNVTSHEQSREITALFNFSNVD